MRPLPGRGALSRPGAGSFGGINQALKSVRSRQELHQDGYLSSFSEYEPWTIQIYCTKNIYSRYLMVQ